MKKYPNTVATIWLCLLFIWLNTGISRASSSITGTIGGNQTIEFGCTPTVLTKLDTYSRSNRAIVSAGSFDSNNLLSAHGQDEPQPGILQQYRVCQGATIIRGQDIRRSGYRFRSKTGHDTECRTDKIASRNFYL